MSRFSRPEKDLASDMRAQGIDPYPPPRYGPPKPPSTAEKISSTILGGTVLVFFVVGWGAVLVFFGWAIITGVWRLLYP